MTHNLSFRVWDKKRECYYYESRPNRIDTCQLWIDLRGWLTSVKEPNHEISNGNFWLERSTGVKDSFGKEIFEGDIIEYSEVKNDGVAMVTYYEMSGAFGLFTKRSVFLHDCKNIKILGNWRQNSDLLKD